MVKHIVAKHIPSGTFIYREINVDVEDKELPRNTTIMGDILEMLKDYKVISRENFSDDVEEFLSLTPSQTYEKVVYGVEKEGVEHIISVATYTNNEESKPHNMLQVVVSPVERTFDKEFSSVSTSRVISHFDEIEETLWDVLQSYE